ncbi:geranylgeranyl transferase type-2 subunit alpha 1-like [Punica granatum]|uniref:Geranylgeranyl transferase type-2 subunit alpha 1-like n=1 Tax=Punica granatum TaxID=22663 RepID=A0A6P8DAI7_PUNGR|nr:geranylgeranyl transferase type-2 subunit alpha 1-like [Punica granatum]XP_031388243.1 geranylgeranyl transferase type-2 subunit alpha 1-like [Punica granatum]
MIMRNFHGKKMTFVTPKDSWKNQVLLRFGVAYRYRDGTDKSLSGPCWELGLLFFSSSKIGKLMLARLLMARDAMLSPCANKTAHSEEVLELYRDLIRSNPPHSQYYKDQSSLVLMQWDHLRSSCGFKSQISATRSLIQLKNRGSATPFLLEPAQQQTGKFLCSGAPEITQVSESAEHLVQRDRLPPYRHQSLSVHVSSDILRRHEDLPNGVDVENYWAAFMVFKDLDLVQLDVAEIPVANEKLQSFLVRIFPALTWLDGRNLH